MLLPELKLNDQTFYLGPNNRLALVGACDANAWLEAIGTLHETGELTFTRVAHDEYRVSGGNNAGISVTWTADGGVLFFNSTRVDPATGQPMDPFEDEPPLRVHAELDDGTLLVSARSTSQKDSFWVLPANAPIDEVPTASPDFIGQASYPAVQVQIDAAGGKAYATFQDWENGRDRTVIVGGSDIRDVTGRV